YALIAREGESGIDLPVVESCLSGLLSVDTVQVGKRLRGAGSCVEERLVVACRRTCRIGHAAVTARVVLRQKVGKAAFERALQEIGWGKHVFCSARDGLGC